MITNQLLKMIAFAEIFSKKYAQCSIVRTLRVVMQQYTLWGMV